MKIDKLQYAIDKNGILVSASQAIKGEPYLCPYCKTGVYVNSSVLGNLYYSTMPGGIHTAPECEMISLSTESSKLKYQLEKTNPKNLLRAILREPQPIRPQKPDAPPSEGQTGGIHPPRLLPFRSLSELYDRGICFLPPNTPMGNGIVGDCCACVESSIANMVDDPLYKGERIVYAGVDDIKGADLRRFNDLIEEGTPRIAFPIFTKFQAEKYRRKYLVLECKTVELLEAIVDVIYQKSIDDFGRMMYRAKCKNVLIAGDWHHGSCIACPHTCSFENRNDCRGVLVASYVSHKQILGIASSLSPNIQRWEMDKRIENCSDSGFEEL